MANLVPGSALTSPLLPSCSAWVSVDGKALPVYASLVDKEGTLAFGYIESEEGAKFTVNFRDGRQEPLQMAYIVHTYLDGRWVRGSMGKTTSATLHEPLNSPKRILSISSTRVSSTLERPFYFTKLEPTDDEEIACTDSDIIEHFGSIELRFFHVAEVKQSTTVAREYPDIWIHEESRKAELSHQTCLGPLKTHKRRSTSTYTYCDSDEQPFCVFQFRYRARDVLELENIAPPLRNPSPRRGRSPAPGVGTPAPAARLPAATPADQQQQLYGQTFSSSEDEMDDGMDDPNGAAVSQFTLEELALQLAKRGRSRSRSMSVVGEANDVGEGAKRRRIGAAGAAAGRSAEQKPEGDWI